MDIYVTRTSIVECPCMDIPAWILMWISTLVWRIEDWYPKIMDIHMENRGFLEIHVWICYWFSDQSSFPEYPEIVLRLCKIPLQGGIHFRNIFLRSIWIKAIKVAQILYHHPLEKAAPVVGIRGAWRQRNRREAFATEPQLNKSAAGGATSPPLPRSRPSGKCGPGLIALSAPKRHFPSAAIIGMKSLGQLGGA